MRRSGGHVHWVFQPSWRGGALLLALCAPPAPAAAREFVVNNTEDAVDADPGDGVCETAPGNHVCTLRAGVQESNAWPGPDTLHLDAGTFTLTIAGEDEDAALGDLDVTEALDIKGDGAGSTFLDGDDADRVLDLQPTAARVRIANLTVQHGYAFDGGGIRFACPLELNRARLQYNEGALGGALYAFAYYPGSDPQLSLIHSDVSNNTATAGGGASLDDATAVLIRNSVFALNHSDTDGGAVDAFYGSVTLIDSQFNDNVASLRPALIANEAFISGCTFASNTAGASAGTVQIRSLGEVANSTFSDNWAPLGGALTVSGVVDVNNVTFEDNEATNPDVDNAGGALSGLSEGTVTLSNSLFSRNYPIDCSEYVNIVSLGFNLTKDASCDLGATGDTINATALVDPVLKDNGGATPTHTLLTGSPAIDSASTVAGSFEAHDQCGADRPQRGSSLGPVRADRGAVELCVAALASSSADSDWDGVPDVCDDDDDGDGCSDSADAHPSAGNIVVGTVHDFCEGTSPYSIWEGGDLDNDGLRNCEDDDDDDDHSLDADDVCDISPHPTGCLTFGKYPCLPSWLDCWGGSCVELFIKLLEVSNPERAIRLERFEIINETMYAAPLAGMTAAQTIQRIAEFGVQSAGARTNVRAAAAPPRTRLALEIWRKATRNARERLVERVMELDAGSARLGNLASGEVIVIEPPGKQGEPLLLSTTWATGAAPSSAPDFDGDRLPDGFDNCTFVANREQTDADRNLIGDACQPVGVGRK